MSAPESGFYVTGGTLRHDAPSYVERQADKDLLAALLQGQFCYVLTSRQMGKSSLMVRTANKLREQGTRIAVLDLSAIGQNLTPEQWYDGLAARLGRQLQIEDDLEDFWQRHQNLGPCQRLFTAVREVALSRNSMERPLMVDGAATGIDKTSAVGSLVVFVDELDVVRSLPFSTDEFFSAIRECYNRRVEDPEFNRLTFCLLGVATPADLVRDTRTTPFNIGRQVELNDFTPQEAGPLVQGLASPEPERAAPPTTPQQRDADNAQGLLERILFWTHGHPYLTQRLCQHVAAAQALAGPADVDRACAELFLSDRARVRDDNLIFVRERLLRSEADRASLLDLYLRVRRGNRVLDDETDPLIGILRLSGIVRTVQGRLKERNRIYERVFDPEWVQSNLPGAELRRQRVAFQRGVLRAAGVATIIVVLMAGLVLFASNKARLARDNFDRAERQREENRRGLVRVNVANGLRLLDEGDAFGSLPWFVEALRLDHGEPQRERNHRLRIAAVLEHSPRLLQTWFHDGPVRYAEFSADGRQVVTASDDGTAQVWDAASGQRIALLRHQAEVKYATFSPDGELVATASADGSGRTWNATTGEPVSPPLRHQTNVNTIRFSPGGRSVATASDDQTARIWDAKTGQPLTESLQAQGAVKCAVFSPDGSRLATLSTDMRLRIWHAAGGELQANVGGFTRYVHDIAFSPDGSTVIGAGWGVAHVLRSETGSEVLPVLRQLQAIRSVAFSLDGNRIVTASDDQTARVWSATNGQQLTLPLRHHHAVNRASFSPDGRWVLTACADGTARVWDAQASEPASPPLQHSGAVTSACFSPDGSAVLTAGEDGMVRLWDLSSTEAEGRELRHRDYVERVVASPDSQRVLTASMDHSAQLWDMNTGARLLAPFHHGAGVVDAVFSPDGKLIVTASLDRTARVWDAIAGQAVTPPLLHSGVVARAWFSHDGRRVITASGEKVSFRGESHHSYISAGPPVLQVWDARSGSPLTPPMPLEASSAPVEPSPDGSEVVTGFEKDSIRRWAAETGKALSPPMKNRWAAKEAAFSPDNRYLVCVSATASTGQGVVSLWRADSASAPVVDLSFLSGAHRGVLSPDARSLLVAARDGSARVWDSLTGRPVGPPLRHRWVVFDAVFSPDGRLIVTGSGDHTARVWDALTGEAVGPPLKHRGYVVRTLFSPDGTRVLTSLAQSIIPSKIEYTAHIWDLPRDDRSIEDLERIAQILAGHRIDSTSSLVPIEPKAFRESWQMVRAKYPDHFAVAPQRLLAWHRRQAGRCESTSDWAGAVTHLTPIIAAQPDEVDNYGRRAEAFAQLARWPQAAADFAHATSLGATETPVWHSAAVLQLKSGDTNAYYQLCANLRRQFAALQDPLRSDELAWICALLPGPATNFDLPLKWIEGMVASESKSELAFINTIGAVWYRAGRFNQAKARLQDELRAMDEGRTTVPRHHRVHNWLFLAMTCQRLDQPDQARQWLESATAWHETADDPLPWFERFELGVLLKEAQELLK